MKKLPRWVLNTLRAKNAYVATWLDRIQVSSQEFNAGYETVIIRVWVGGRGREMHIRRITGRNYADRALMRCFECERTTAQLAKADIHNQHLRACGCIDCRVLLCVYCLKNHEAMHELGGEAMVNPWSRAAVREYDTKGNQ